MNLKRKILMTAAVLGIVAFATISLSLKGPKALTLETGAGIATQSECQYYQGYWNMALICGGGGVNSFNTLKIT
jgi:hypothetical protein